MSYILKNNKRKSKTLSLIPISLFEYVGEIHKISLWCYRQQPFQALLETAAQGKFELLRLQGCVYAESQSFDSNRR